MKNTLSVTIVNGCVRTDFVTTDGVTSMEIHRAGLSDAKVLSRLVDKKFYQHFKGEWIISFPDEPYTISQPTFEKLIDVAQIHIFNRDNSYPDYSGFC